VWDNPGSLESPAQPARVRRATEQDLDAVRGCLSEAFAPYEAAYSVAAFRDTVPDVDGLVERSRAMTILVAEAEDGTIVGTIAHEVGLSGAGHLRGMAILPQTLGAGVASQLLQSAEEALASARCTRVTLETTRPLQRAIRFYQPHGYRATGRVSDFFGMELVEYAKELGGKS
jgi:ribosomal protein S18 acetylase RimI-like enzyme